MRNAPAHERDERMCRRSSGDESTVDFVPANQAKPSISIWLASERIYANAWSGAPAIDELQH